MKIPHIPRILIVENDKPTAEVIRLFLSMKYLVTAAYSYEDAKFQLENEHFHLAIVDLYLVDNDYKNAQGLELLRYINATDLNDVMDRISMSSTRDPDTLTEMATGLGVLNHIVKDTAYVQKIVQEVDALFGRIEPDNEIKRRIKRYSNLHINFGLKYLDDTDRELQLVIKNIRWGDNIAHPPPISRLQPQVDDLFGKVFRDAYDLLLAPLIPGLTGASVLKVIAKRDGGITHPTVVKIGRRDKMMTEQEHYNAAHDFFTGMIAKLEVVYTRDLGAIQYAFASRGGNPMKEYETYYRMHSATDATKALERIFDRFELCFANKQPRPTTSLPEMYYNAFELKRPDQSAVEYLANHISTIVPEFDLNTELFQFPGLPIDLPNPLHWLVCQRDGYGMTVYQAFTHGDLTGRNVMIDETGEAYLIDFYRTYQSHIMRDFVVLETDIKYRFAKTESLQEFLLVEMALLNGTHLPAPASADRVKTFHVLHKLRQIARKYPYTPTGLFNASNVEFLISLLMATLNVVRLRHIEKEQKLQALVSAALLTNKLRIQAKVKEIPFDLSIYERLG